ncbi:response regulator [Catalinimonas niigatensis]|uniref:response regulator n=1 Tax=Catalinimonas niigatensis TaxID=1397264 RepID=UPI002665246F|nr:response regulator transcription factor [Catalinimonas niigatensis]WPP53074.1 response regulator transcription factor [Catalinimonas niigatensis]
MEKELKLIIVDDHTLFRQSLSRLLAVTLEMVSIKEASNGKELMDMIDEQSPDIILLDLEMPEMDGLETSHILLNHAKYKDIKIIILTMHENEEFMLELIEKGVYGYLFKDADIEEVLKAIRIVDNGQYYISQRTFNALRKRLIKSTKFQNYLDQDTEKLTPREEEILTLICKEYTNREVAKELGLSVRTIDGHRNRILKKTGMKNTAGLVKFALRSGFYSMD